VTLSDGVLVDEISKPIEFLLPSIDLGEIGWRGCRECSAEYGRGDAGVQDASAANCHGWIVSWSLRERFHKPQFGILLKNDSERAAIIRPDIIDYDGSVWTQGVEEIHISHEYPRAVHTDQVSHRPPLEPREQCIYSGNEHDYPLRSLPPRLLGIGLFGVGFLMAGVVEWALRNGYVIAPGGTALLAFLVNVYGVAFLIFVHCWP